MLATSGPGDGVRRRVAGAVIHRITCYSSRPNGLDGDVTCRWRCVPRSAALTSLDGVAAGVDPLGRIIE
jgi:hypothetical protein